MRAICGMVLPVISHQGREPDGKGQAAWGLSCVWADGCFHGVLGAAAAAAFFGAAAFFTAGLAAALLATGFFAAADLTAVAFFAGSAFFAAGFLAVAMEDLLDGHEAKNASGATIGQKRCMALRPHADAMP